MIVSVVVVALFQTIPGKIILLFGGGNDLYIEFAKTFFRLYMMLMIGSSVTVPVISFLQAVVPIFGMFIMGYFFGIFGVVSTRAIADGVAFLLSVLLLVGKLHTFRLIPEECAENS